VDGTQAAIAHLGAAYAQLGDNDRSRTFHERALAIASEKRWPQQAAMAHINLGWLAIVDGDYASALTSFQAAGALVNDEQSWHFHRAWAALGLGTSLVELNDAEAALPHLETALGESRLAQSVTSETEAQRKLGRAYLAIGDLPASEAALSEALRLVGSDLPRRGATLSQWARLAERRGDLTAARRYVEEAIEIRESLRARVTSDELRASFLARWRDDYALLIDLLVRLDAERPGEGLSAEALAVSERARSRVLHELLTEARLGARGYLSPEQADRQKEIETRLSSIQHELFRRTGGDEAQLREQLANTQDDWTRLEREIRATAPRYADLHYPQPLTLGEIQTALDEGSALVEFALGEPRSYLFVVTRMNLKVHELAAAADIAAVVEAAREAMQKPLPFLWPQQAAVLHELYRLVLAPAEPDLEGVDSLLIAPDLVLYYLPFEALLTRPPSGGIATSLAGDSVLARWSVSYVPSATVFDGLPEATTIDDGGHELLAFADPTGDGGVASGSVGWSSESRWPPLPGAVAEVRAIAELFDPETVEIYHGAAASEKAVKSLPGLAVARRLHFASHGVLDEKRPAYSGLVLAAEADGSEDGLLQVREIFELSLAAEVAVLSACESGLGKHVQGEGLVGLSRAFFYAGVPTVVVSLWQVTDASTPDLMADFYRQLTAGRSPSVALRSAKLSMIRKGKWSHPNFWAPFIVLGRP
jgi:CHAT domain-containing protein